MRIASAPKPGAGVPDKAARKHQCQMAGWVAFFYSCPRRREARFGSKRGHSSVCRSLSLRSTWLDELVDGTDFLLKHNLINFDLPHQRAAIPYLGVKFLARCGCASTPGIPASS